MMGRPMVKQLAENGAAVTTYDLPSGDILVLQDITEAVIGQDIVIHLAANSNVELSRNDPLATWETNIRGTWNVLQACHEAEVKAVVTAASNHVYGKQETFPVLESASMNQLDAYSVSKICADYLTRAYAHNYGTPTASIRNTNCYGPNDPHSSHLIPGTILSILKGERPVIRSNGQTRKGYLYVDDVVDGYLVVAECLYRRLVPSGQAFNIGAPAVAALSVVDLIRDIMGSSVLADILGEANDQADEQMDSSKIEQLGWSAKTPLREGLKKTIAWFQANAPAGVAS